MDHSNDRAPETVLLILGSAAGELTWAATLVDRAESRQEPDRTTQSRGQAPEDSLNKHQFSYVTLVVSRPRTAGHLHTTEHPTTTTAKGVRLPVHVSPVDAYGQRCRGQTGVLPMQMVAS